MTQLVQAGLAKAGVRLGVMPSTGKLILQHSGATVADIDDWIPIEWDSDVVKRVQVESAVERYGNRRPMNTATKRVPRSAGLTVSSGTTYTDDASENDYVLLTARRFISRFKVDEDDLNDAEMIVDVLGEKGVDWAISYADVFDNACLAVSAAENGTTVPFTSVYKTLRTSYTSSPDLGYTADDNYLTWDDDYFAIASTPDGTSFYEKASATLAKVEGGKYWSQADMVCIAHPSYRDVMRRALDGNGSPIFKESAHVDAVTGRMVDTLFGLPIAWSRGAKVSATNTGDPTGRALLFFVNGRYLQKGDRSGPETLTDMARAQDDTDDAAVKFRTRRGFALGHPKAAAVLERLTD